MDQVETLNHLVIAVGLAGGVMLVSERVKRGNGKPSSWPLAMAMLMFLIVGFAAMAVGGVDPQKDAEVDAVREALQHLLVLMFMVLAATAVRRLYLAMIESDGARSNTLAFRFGAATVVGGIACGLVVSGAQSLLPLLGEINGFGPTMASELAALAAFLLTVWVMNIFLNMENSGTRETKARLLKRTNTFGGSWMSATAAPSTYIEHERGRFATRVFPVWEYDGELLCTQDAQRGLISLHRAAGNICIVPERRYHEIALIVQWAKQPNARRMFWRIKAAPVTRAAFPLATIWISSLRLWLFRRRKAMLRPLATVEIKTGLRRLDTDLLRSAGIEIRVRRSDIVESGESRSLDRANQPPASGEASM